MPDFSQYSDEELARIAGVKRSSPETKDLSSYSDEELKQIASNDKSWGQVGTSAISNIPESAINYGKNIYQAVRHPVETGKAVGGLALGTIEQAIPGEQESEVYFDAMGKMLKDRYGSIANLKTTIANDPVGFISDLSTVFTGGGAVIGGAGSLGKVGTLTKAGGTISKVGRAIDPINMT